MQRPADVGIKAIELYVPNQCVEQRELEKFDGVGEGKYTIGLGQASMGFCDDREDIYSLALTAVSSLMRKYDVDPCSIGRLEVGTETILDKSKSVKTVLMQLFQHCNTNIEGVDTVNACYGGTNALFNAINWIESSSWDGRDAIVVAGDIAIYEKGPARPSGGAGCVAMLIGPHAPLAIESDLRGSHFRHTYDFYKSDFSSEYPRVDGPLSLKCYTEAVDACYEAYLARDGPGAQMNGANGHGATANGSTRRVVKSAAGLFDANDQNGVHDANGVKSLTQQDAPSKSINGGDQVSTNINGVQPPKSNGHIAEPSVSRKDSHCPETNGHSTNMNGNERRNSSGPLPADRFDYMCFHAPTTKTVAKSYARLFYNDYLACGDHEEFSDVPSEMGSVSYETSLNDKKIEKTFQILSETRFKERVQPSVYVPSQCGNMYTASLYSGLCSLLSLVDSKDLQGKRIGMFSYGSGLASSLFSLKVVGSTQEIKAKLNLLETLSKRTVAPPDTYEVTCCLRELAYQRKSYKPIGDVGRLAPGTYYLVGVDDMSRRSYAVKQ